MAAQAQEQIPYQLQLLLARARRASSDMGGSVLRTDEDGQNCGRTSAVLRYMATFEHEPFFAREGGPV